MTRKCACVLAALLLLLPLTAWAETYAFPYAGVRVDMEPEWTVLTPGTLEAEQDFLKQLDLDMEVLRADYAANSTAFEAFLPGGVQVSLSVLETEKTLAFGDMERMAQADIDAFLQSYARAPYENVRWLKEAPGCLAYQWTLESGGVEVPFARLCTIRQGALYTLTATGVGVSVDALDAANARVLGGISFLGARAGTAAEDSEVVNIPAPIADDGRVVPVSLVEFTGITTTDLTTLTIETLPGAELLLQTASDTLRGRADEQGLHSYELSTRRETAYTYTLTVTAEGRAASTMDIAIARRLSAEEMETAYRYAAQPIEALGYGQIAGEPDAFEGQAITFRGKASAFADIGGFPCVLVCTANTGTDMWEDPLWVMLTQAVAVAKDEMVTVYGDIRGDTLVYGQEGEGLSAPVVIGRVLVK